MIPIPDQARLVDAVFRLSGFKLLLHWVPRGSVACCVCGMPRGVDSNRHHMVEIEPQAFFNDEVSCCDLLWR